MNKHTGYRENIPWLRDRCVMSSNASVWGISGIPERVQVL